MTHSPVSGVHTELAECHSDDVAIDEFAAAMKAKMAQKRAEGRGGWDDPGECSIFELAQMLVEHLPKGDPVDIANFAMMLFHRENGTEAIQITALAAFIVRCVNSHEAMKKALAWALPLAETAMENHRYERIKNGHNGDIKGTYKSGQTWVGIWQNEVDAIESARTALSLASGEKT